MQQSPDLDDDIEPSISNPSGPSQGGFPHLDLQYPRTTLTSWLYSDTDMESRFASLSLRAPRSETEPIAPISPTAQTTPTSTTTPGDPMSRVLLAASTDQETAASNAQLRAVEERRERIRTLREKLASTMSLQCDVADAVTLLKRTRQIQEERCEFKKGIIAELQRRVDAGEGMPDMEGEFMDMESQIRHYEREQSEEEKHISQDWLEQEYYLAEVERIKEKVRRIQQELRELEVANCETALPQP